MALQSIPRLEPISDQEPLGRSEIPVPLRKDLAIRPKFYIAKLSSPKGP